MAGEKTPSTGHVHCVLQALCGQDLPLRIPKSNLCWQFLVPPELRYLNVLETRPTFIWPLPSTAHHPPLSWPHFDNKGHSRHDTCEEKDNLEDLLPQRSETAPYQPTRILLAPFLKSLTLKCIGGLICLDLLSLRQQEKIQTVRCNLHSSAPRMHCICLTPLADETTALSMRTAFCMFCAGGISPPPHAAPPRIPRSVFCQGVLVPHGPRYFQ